VWRPEDHVSFFTGAEGYGLFTQRRDEGRQHEQIEVMQGRLRVARLIFEVPEELTADRVDVVLGARQLPVQMALDEGQLSIELTEPVTLEAGQLLTVEIR
jgi:hypothetical protein